MNIYHRVGMILRLHPYDYFFIIMLIMQGNRKDMTLSKRMMNKKNGLRLMKEEIVLSTDIQINSLEALCNMEKAVRLLVRVD